MSNLIGRCTRCNTWRAWFHVTDRKGQMVASCANCLTDHERTAFDPQAVNAKLQPKQEAEA
jgi:Zn-finger protein